MFVIGERCWLVDQSIPTQNYPEKSRQVFTSASAASDAKGEVKAPFLFKKSCSKSHSCACAKSSCCEGIERSILPSTSPVEDMLVETFIKPSKFFKPELRGSFQLQRQNQTCDAGHILCCLEPSDQASQPAGINDYIIVGEGDNLSSRFHSAPIASRRQSRAVFACIAYFRLIGVGLPDEVSRGAGGGSVIYYNYFIAWILQRQ